MLAEMMRVINFVILARRNRLCSLQVRQVYIRRWGCSTDRLSGNALGHVKPTAIAMENDKAELKKVGKVEDPGIKHVLSAKSSELCCSAFQACFARLAHC